MPKKLNFLGGQQNYDADNGQYLPALQGPNGESPSGFQSFKKPKSEFDKNNEKRIGKKKTEKDEKKWTSDDVEDVGDDVTDEEIAEALGDYEYWVTDKTTVKDYAEQIAKKLGTSPDKVKKVIENEIGVDLGDDENMAKLLENANKEDEDIENDKKVDGDDQEIFDYNYNVAKSFDYEHAKKLQDLIIEKYGKDHIAVKAIQKALDEMNGSEKEKLGKISATHDAIMSDPSKYLKDTEITQVKALGNAFNHPYTVTLDIVATYMANGQDFKTAIDSAWKDISKSVKNFGKPEKKVEDKPTEKDINGYTDDLFKAAKVTTFTSKKYKNPQGEIVEIRRFGEGQNAIRYNETKKEVEQVWIDGKRVK